MPSSQVRERHELQVAAGAGRLGSSTRTWAPPISAGTRTASPATCLATEVMLEVLAMGGFTSGRLNFDAKRGGELRAGRSLPCAHPRHGHLRRRPRGAAAIRADGSIDEFISRYGSWDSDLGRRIESGGDARRPPCTCHWGGSLRSVRSSGATGIDPEQVHQVSPAVPWSSRQRHHRRR